MLAESRHRRIGALNNAAASGLRPPLRAVTRETLFGLPAVTGMRLGEALNLDRDDIDWRAATLLIRDAKFGRSRRLPLHPSTISALARYAERRDEWGSAGVDPLFPTSRGGPRRLAFLEGL